MTKVGVAIVTRNSEEHVAACLRSLTIAADGLPLSVVVVDNDSNDQSVKVARQSWPGLNLIQNRSNVGFARAANAACAALVDCSYLLLLNPDATMQPGSLGRLRDALEASPHVAASGPQLRYPDGRHQISARPLPTLVGVIYDALLLYHLMSRPDLVEQFPGSPGPSEVDCLSGACLLIRRECFDALQGFDERFFLYGEDVDLCARLRGLGRALLLVPEALVFHVEGASAFRDRSLFFLEIHRARALYVRKHFGPTPAFLAIAAQVAGLAVRGILYPFGPLLGRPDLRPYWRYQWAALAAVLGFVPARRR